MVFEEEGNAWVEGGVHFTKAVAPKFWAIAQNRYDFNLAK